MSRAAIDAQGKCNPMKHARPWLCALVALAILGPKPAAAQVAGFALDTFNPSERGSDWFALDSLDLRDNVREAVGIVGDLAYLPLVIYKPDGSIDFKLVEEQIVLHTGLSMVFLDRFRLALDFPVAVYENGQSGTANGVTYTAPASFAVGDLRIGADVRLIGAYRDRFRLGVGAQIFAPLGSRSNYTGDGKTRVQGHVSAAGDIGLVAYAAQIGFQYRSLTDSFGASALGSQATFGASIGLRPFDHGHSDVLLVGPEVYGATTVSNQDLVFKGETTPVEAILGAHVRLAGSWRLGLGGGAGFTHGFGSPAARALAMVEWAPDPPPPDRDGDGVADFEDACPDVPGSWTEDPKTSGCPPDRDGDGITDAEDACPTVPGVRTTDPHTNGCPPDRDHDGIPDGEDACPDIAGVRTDDPKTNGCPPDRDGDGILDADDACPDVAGVRTADPKTNGCPADPDRDKDGIPNAEDACPDEPGPKNADPAKNGCPEAVLKDDRIVILEQVQFATDSAVILPASNSLLEAVLKIFKDHPELRRVSIEGHTDSRGSPAYNKALSARRAASVVRWLMDHGVDPLRLASVGYGLERPIDTNETDKGRQNNRRVEFHVIQTAK